MMSETDWDNLPAAAGVKLEDETMETQTMRRWINLYPPCDTEGPHPWRTTSWISRELADAHAKPGRIACVEVAFAHGDGLTRKETIHVEAR